MSDEALISSLRDVLEDGLRQGVGIDIDGIGTIEVNIRGELIFNRNSRARVFLAYAQEDRDAVRKLYKQLQSSGFAAWMDVETLLPGQNWSRAIERAIETSDYFIACFSSRSSNKRGYFQSELAYALDVASRVPVEQAFFVPVRLDQCKIPSHIAKKIHYMDLFPNWDSGVSLLAFALHAHERNKKRQSEVD